MRAIKEKIAFNKVLANHIDVFLLRKMPLGPLVGVV